MQSTFAASFSEAASLLEATRTDASLMAGLELAAQLLAECFQSDHKVMTCGNGGSMADAMHFAEEWTGRFRANRRPFPALAFSDPTHLTCTSNDYGFDHVFERMVQAFGKPGDLLLLLTTTGNSVNLNLAAQAARSQGVRTIAFLGKGGGALRSHCDVPLLFPGNTSDRIQELHMLSLHALIETVEGCLLA